MIEKMKFRNEKQPILGVLGTIVQVDETMMNYKCGFFVDFRLTIGLTLWG
jgi:hypothetical protein